MKIDIKYSPKPIIGLTVNRRRGDFTRADIFTANGQAVSMLTITKRIRDLRKTGELHRVGMTAPRNERPTSIYGFKTTSGWCTIERRHVRTKQLFANLKKLG